MGCWDKWLLLTKLSENLKNFNKILGNSQNSKNNQNFSTFGFCFGMWPKAQYFSVFGIRLWLNEKMQLRPFTAKYNTQSSCTNWCSTPKDKRGLDILQKALWCTEDVRSMSLCSLYGQLSQGQRANFSAFIASKSFDLWTIT